MKHRWSLQALIWLSLLSTTTLLGQTDEDTVAINNGNFVVGEIIWMDANRLRIKPDYGFGEWEVKWSRVVGIDTRNTFQVDLSNGKSYYGSLRSIPSGGIYIITAEKDTLSTNLHQVVVIRPVKNRFIDKLDASISLGFNLARARNLVSFTSRSSINYKAKKVAIGLTYDALRSRQDNTDNISRTERAMDFTYFFPKQYYGSALISALSNTEQKLDLRLTLNAALGKYLFSTQALYWGIMAGANNNFERFSNETEDRNSWEALLGTQFNIFNMGSLKLQTSAIAYPSITEPGRWRTDYKFDIKYDIKYLRSSGLTNKVFVKLGFSVNYDNRPANNAPETDYVLNMTVGFSWNE